MAARDRFSIDLKCPTCTKAGVAKVSEDDYPFMRSPGFHVDECPEGFTYMQKGDSRTQTEFRCAACGVVVK